LQENYKSQNNQRKHKSGGGKTDRRQIFKSDFDEKPSCSPDEAQDEPDNYFHFEERGRLVRLRAREREKML
jgi:hypothetical protein